MSKIDELQATDAAQREYAERVFFNILKISEHDPVAATQMIKIEAEHGGNPYLQKLWGITFNANTKDGWVTTGAPDGNVYKAYLPNLAEAIKAGPDSTLYKQTIIKIGEGGTLFDKSKIH